jgi:hypothetical protein
MERALQSCARVKRSLRLLVAVLWLGGCSLATVRPPPSGPGTDCTTDKTAPVVDLIGAGAVGAIAVSALSSDDRAAWESPGKAAFLASVTALTLSGLWGLSRVNACRERRKGVEPANRRLDAPAADPWLAAGPPPGVPTADAGAAPHGDAGVTP